MNEVDMIAVFGMCGPERTHYATRLAAVADRALFSARRLSLSPDPVDETLALVPWTDREAGAVVEFPASSPVTEVIGACAGERSHVRLSDLVCVADALHLIDDLRGDASVPRAAHRAPGGSLGPVDASGAHLPGPVEYTARAMLTVSQLEFASMIVLVNWQGLSTSNLAALMALVSHLSPRARIRLDHGALEPPDGRAPYGASQERPGWVAMLNDEHDPHMRDARVSALRYEQLRPFHPERLQRVLDERLDAGEFGTVIRSAGFCRLATRPDIIGSWDHVGSTISFEPLARAGVGDEPLAAGQDLAIIGIDLRENELREALDSATLTDEELTAGPAAWRSFADPLPAWAQAPQGSE